MRSNLVVVASWAGSIGLASSLEFPPNATEIFGPYVHDNGTLATWMSRHADETPLEQLNIPGTHDSATWNYTQATQDALANITAGDGEPTYPPEVFRCQGASIMASLSAGVRFFDLRFALDPTGTKLVFWHSQALMSEQATVGDVVNAFYYWLDLHPSETVILSFQYEGSTIVNATFDATVQHMIFDILNSTTAARYIDQTRDVLSTLGAARGKVVLFRRFDLDELPDEYEAALPGLHLSPSLWADNSRNTSLTYNTALNMTAYIEDYYEPDDLGDASSAADNIAAKVNATVSHLEMAISDAPEYARSLFVTFASAEHVTAMPVAVTPQIMALGVGNSSTPLGGVNQQIVPIIKKLEGRRMGIVIVDFWDEPRDMIESILGL
jgi:1-phosphatidylinositol phosphodiesterase